MRADGALGMARGARRVEHRRVVVGRELDLRRCRGGTDRTDVLVEVDGAHALVRGTQTRRSLRVLADDHDRRQVGKVVQRTANPLEALFVDEEHRTARVTEAVLQLLGGPPRVDRDDDGAGQHRAPERDDPLGKVSRRDRHAVALDDPVGEEAVGERGRGAVVLVEGEALALVDEEVTRRVEQREVEYLTQRRRRVLPHRHLDAVDGRALRLEHRARRRHLGRGLGHRHEGLTHRASGGQPAPSGTGCRGSAAVPAIDSRISSRARCVVSFSGIASKTSGCQRRVSSFSVDTSTLR